MKNIIRVSALLPLFVGAAFGADLIVTEDTTYNATADNVIFQNSATVQNGSAIAINYGIQVDSGVNAVWDNSSSSNKHIYVGNATFTDAYISGAGKELSSFDFTGYHLSAKRQSSGACGALTVSDITLTYTGSYGSSGKATNGGYFRFGILTMDNAVLNFQEGRFGIARSNSLLGIDSSVPTVSLTNSQINFNTTGNFVLENGCTDVTGTSFTLDNSSINFNQKVDFNTIDGSKPNLTFNMSNGSSVAIKGNSSNLRGTNWNLDNSTLLVSGSSVNFGGANGEGTGLITLTNGSTFNMTGTNVTSIIRVSNTGSTVNIGDGALLSAQLTVMNNSKFTGNGEFGYTNRGTPQTMLTGNNFLNVSTMALCNINSTNRGTLSVGVDENGVEKQVSLAATSFQLNEGYVVLKGGSTLSATANFNLADTNYTLGGHYFGAGTTVNVGRASRMHVGEIAGTVNVAAGDVVTSYGWDYAYALGVLYTMNAAGTEWVQSASPQMQEAHMTIASTAAINVNMDDSYTGDRGAFTIIGQVISNAGEAMIKSGQYSKFLIRSNIWNTSHQTVLTLNTTDAFAVGGASTQAASTFWLDGSANVKFVVNAENTIGAVNFAGVQTNTGMGGDNLLTLDLNANLTVGQFTGDLVKIILADDLDKNIFKITDMADVLADYVSTGSSATLKFLSDSTTERVLNDNLFIEALGGDVYTIYTAIPEPAEWAMILGALSLAVVAYRRRK